MIRRGTWILLLIFALLVGLAFYLQKNPLPSEAERTPSPTAPVQVLSGVNSSNITGIALVSGSEEPAKISINAQGEWVVGETGGQMAETGKVEQLRAEIASLQVMTSLPDRFELEPAGLVDTAKALKIQTDQGKQIEILIGNETATGSGYYIQVNSDNPVVIEKAAIDTILELILEIVAPAPTETAPATENTPQQTAAP